MLGRKRQLIGITAQTIRCSVQQAWQLNVAFNFSWLEGKYIVCPHLHVNGIVFCTYENPGSVFVTS